MSYLLIIALIGFGLGISIGIKKGVIALTPLIILFITYLLTSSNDVLLNALIIFVAPTILLASLLGLASGYSLKTGNKLLSIAWITPVILCWASLTLIEKQKVDDLPKVTEFIKNSKEVSLVLGEIKSIEEHPPIIISQSKSLPDIFALTVYGANEKKVIAVVDVSRPLWAPTFKMACIVTHTENFDIFHPCQLN
ncbi:hypothetical protein [Methylotenera sp.]|uniref:hypothetical protein n=1 Tax=Methylotenera sp. TaxID=2051956 RepID=UPI00248A80F7|nr:hypothetical protein [Methylotenera sp.]MDI1298343.1 hypothetical protein [Methylotenera sp.]